MSSTPLKRRLRRATIDAILAIPESVRREQEKGMLTRLAALPSYREAETVLLYIKAFPEEFDTGPLLASALATGKRIACPRVDRSAGGLVLHIVVDPRADLAAGTLNIPEPRRDSPVIEPCEVDWALAPGVAFDASCNRIGRGAGHYDRLLPRIRSGVEVWAAAFDAQILGTIPVEPHDVPLHGVVTPTRVFIRGQSGWVQEASGGFA